MFEVRFRQTLSCISRLFNWARNNVTNFRRPTKRIKLRNFLRGGAKSRVVIVSWTMRKFLFFGYVHVLSGPVLLFSCDIFSERKRKSDESDFNLFTRAEEKRSWMFQCECHKLHRMYFLSPSYSQVAFSSNIRRSDWSKELFSFKKTWND